MSEQDPLERRDVQLQLAIFEVVRAARGKSPAEIRQMLRSAFARRRLSNPPGPWMDAATSEAFYGKPYIVDLPAAAAATNAMDAHDRQVGQEPGSQRADRASAGGLTLVRGIVAGAVALCLVLCAVTAVRAARTRAGKRRLDHRQQHESVMPGSAGRRPTPGPQVTGAGRPGTQLVPESQP